MNLLKTLKSKAGSIAFPALNWYKIGAAVVVLAAYTVFIHQRATHACELKQEKQKTEQAEKHTQEVVDHVTERLPEVQRIEVESAEQRNRIRILSQRLKEAINENTNRQNPTCDLSGAELNEVQQLIKESKQAAE